MKLYLLILLLLLLAGCAGKHIHVITDGRYLACHRYNMCSDQVEEYRYGTTRCWQEPGREMECE